MAGASPAGLPLAELRGYLIGRVITEDRGMRPAGSGHRVGFFEGVQPLRIHRSGGVLMFFVRRCVPSVHGFLFDGQGGSLAFVRCVSVRGR